VQASDWEQQEVMDRASKTGLALGWVFVANDNEPKSWPRSQISGVNDDQGTMHLQSSEVSSNFD
jgi:hypothetical protein